MTRIKEYTYEELIYIKGKCEEVCIEWDKIESDENGSLLSQCKFEYIKKTRIINIDIVMK